MQWRLWTRCHFDPPSHVLQEDTKRNAVKTSYGDNIYSLVFAVSYLRGVSKGYVVWRAELPIQRWPVTVERSASAQRSAQAPSCAWLLSILRSGLQRLELHLSHSLDLVRGVLMPCCR